MYHEWRIAHNATGIDLIECDLEEVSTFSVESFIFGVKRFVTEIHKLDGSDFPAKTLYQIVVCLQFHLENIRLMWRLLDDKDFTEVQFTLDNVMKQCVSSGIGIRVKKADIISVVDEDFLWQNCILGSENPQQLLDTVVYLVGLNCVLRAGKEHRVLRSIPFNGQFEWVHDDKLQVYFLWYTEGIGLKTNKGGIKHQKLDPKIIDVYPIPNSYRCPVRIIGMYLSLLPENRSCSAFYLQPLRNFTPNCWYDDRPVGVNKLQKVLKIICEKEGTPWLLYQPFPKSNSN